MSAPLMVTVSGIRGIAGESLTPEVVLAFAQALGTSVGEGKTIALSRDNRPSGVLFGAAATAGLLSTGCSILDLGIAPTPTLGVAVRDRGLAGGIQISASHNPAPWNGLKLFGAQGAVLSEETGAEIAGLFNQRAFHRALTYRSDALRAAPPHHDPLSAESIHRRLAVAVANVEAVRRKGYRVFVDANGGAGGPLARDLLQDGLGCMVEGIGLHPTDHFIHEPEPTRENLSSVVPLLIQKRTAVGFALDPDADRLAIFDETGRYIGEELTLVLAAEHVLRYKKGPVVVNMSSSRATEDIARRHGCLFIRSAVGEANVVKRMREVDAVIGGEGNGGVIDPRVGWVRDPFVGIALTLSLMAETGQPLSAIVDSLPKYFIRKDKYALPADRLAATYDRLISRFDDATINREDGLRLDWVDRWIHIRPSNTEPIVRVIAEAPNQELAEQLCQAVGGLLR